MLNPDTLCVCVRSRKRYEKAEAEYVAAKLELHRKTELKEQLTEHLCAIIQQNEQRKALKLEELMQQLQLQEGEEQEVAPPAAEEDTDKVGTSGGAALAAGGGASSAEGEAGGGAAGGCSVGQSAGTAGERRENGVGSEQEVEH